MLYGSFGICSPMWNNGFNEVFSGNDRASHLLGLRQLGTLRRTALNQFFQCFPTVLVGEHEEFHLPLFPLTFHIFAKLLGKYFIFWSRKFCFRHCYCLVQLLTHTALM